ncbi:MAG: hypothetical protein ACI8SE_001917 [Bacteroidia bacterium]|jgi:hypothetical protein
MRSIFSKRILYVLLILALIGGMVVAYFYFMPHRNVVDMNAEVTIEADALVKEYLDNADAANNKYLSEEGESTILAVIGTVSTITTDQNDQRVVLLKNAEANAGVSCTFTSETNNQVKNIKEGERVRIKGVIRSGAGYDEDLELYEDVIIEKCTVLKK